MGLDFANKLSNVVSQLLFEAENEAVKHHGQWILAAIEGTTWAGPGSRTLADESSSALVQMLDQAKVE
jgi:hypothetical protein